MEVVQEEAGGDEPREERAATTRTGKRKGSEWEILGNLEKGVSYTIRPRRHEGFMHKRRKWPLKGWTKRYFLLEAGHLTYGKSQADLLRGRSLGKISIGQAVISANYAEMRIDIDAEESVHHVRLDSMEHFGLFLEQLQQHRLSVQHSLHLSVEEEADGEVGEEVGRRRGSTPSGPPSLPGHRASLVRGLRPARAALVNEFTQLDEKMVARLESLQSQMGHLLESLGRGEEEQAKRGMGGKLFHLRRKKVTATKSSERGTSPVPMAPPSPGEEDPPSTSTSHSSLSSVTRPASLPMDPASSRLREDSRKRGCEESVSVALDIQAELAAVQASYNTERDHLRQLLENDSKSSSLATPSMAVTTSLRQVGLSTAHHI